MGGKKKKNQPVQTGQKARKGKGRRRNPLGGVLGAVVPGLTREAGKLLKEIVPAMLAFPTSGASAMATPNLALGGYGSSMALSAPAANGTYVKHNKAKMRSNRSGMSIRHREYVQDITFGEAGEYMNMVSAPINPGNRELFPWLAGIATRFETFKFNSLRFIYEPQCGTDNEGTVMMAVDFDAVDLPPVDKLQLMTYDGAIRSPPWFAGVYECAQYNLHKYKEYFITNSLTTPLSTDEKTYFVGNIYVATQSQSASFTAGELYVEYDVVLSTPQLSTISYVDGKYLAASRSQTGEYSTVFEAGDLDVMVGSTPDISNSQYVIPTPGGWLVSVSAFSANLVGELNTSVSTSSPAAGFEEASIYQVASVNGVTYPGNPEGVAIFSAIVIQLNGPTFFRVLSSFTGLTDSASFDVVITPIDASILRTIGPLSNPIINPRPNRFTSFMHKREMLAKPKRNKPLLLEESNPLPKGETQVKKLSSTPIFPGPKCPAVPVKSRVMS